MSDRRSVAIDPPPSTNHLFATVRRPDGAPIRVKTKRYRNWAFANGWRVKALGQHTHAARWTLHIVVHHKPANRDVSNYIKPIEDLICAVCGLEDRNVIEVLALHDDAGDAHGVTVHLTIIDREAA